MMDTITKIKRCVRILRWSRDKPVFFVLLFAILIKSLSAGYYNLPDTKKTNPEMTSGPVFKYWLCFNTVILLLFSPPVPVRKIHV